MAEFPSADPKDPSTWHNVKVDIPFPSPEQATTARRVLEVDKPVKSHMIIRTLSTEGSNLIASFSSLTVRQARVALDHFLSDVGLVVETISELGPPSLTDAKQSL